MIEISQLMVLISFMQIIPVIKKEGMFGMYYKESLALKTLDIINLTEYFVWKSQCRIKKYILLLPIDVPLKVHENLKI